MLLSTPTSARSWPSSSAPSHLKTWRMLSEEGGRYRAPISKYATMLQAVIGLCFYAAYE